MTQHAGSGAKQPQSLKGFLMELHDDPKSLVNFKKDPKAAIQGSQLSGDHKKVLLSGDPRKISQQLRKEIGAPQSIIVIVLVV